ncbi:uncharacterized protein JCM6883_007081 [Sporobolomyces salmoneus]|uniref:uncharacterized protein n=1 Tax=Sporobolomyces salmoneus TaxID=183962 RepID=UPI00316D0EF7
MVLVTALFKALVALYHLLSSTEVQGGVQRLFKRAPIPVSPSTPSNELLIQPFIPGLTTSLSALPTLILALSLSQIYHEFGHALCASSSSSELSIHSTGLYLFFLIFPVFYVSISPPIRQTKSNPFDDLRIASAGIWHNVWLVFVGWLAMSKESGGLGWSERAFRKSGMLRELERGVRVIVTKPVSHLSPQSWISMVLNGTGEAQQSPLSTLLIPGGTTITHLNDLELDGSATEGGGPLALFDDYLGRRVEEAEEESYENMGWCLSKELFKPLPTTAPTNYTEHQIFEGLACCEKQTAPIAAGGGGTLNHDLCFKTISMFPRSEDEPASVRFATCLDPTTSLLSPPDSSKEKVQRCLNQQSCDQPGQVCARLGHDVVRLEIEVDEGMEKKRKELVIWKGSRNELGRIGKETSSCRDRGICDGLMRLLLLVQVTDVESRYWFVPLGIDQSIAKFFS